jgi:transaldolase
MDLAIKMFADGADLEHIRAFAKDPRVAGFTTNPTLMRKAGVSDYRAFAQQAIRLVSPLPISFEVFSDDHDEMVRQAELIASWGENVYVKIPVTDTKGESTDRVIRRLSADGVQLNVTAIMTLAQVERVASALSPDTPSIVSVFAGRIADAGVDPIPIMVAAKGILGLRPRSQLLWASPREILNLIQAEAAGCDIITMTSDLWTKIANLQKDLGAYSLETVQMFHEDARHAGYSL